MLVAFHFYNIEFSICFFRRVKSTSRLYTLTHLSLISMCKSHIYLFQEGLLLDIVELTLEALSLIVT